MKIHLIVSFLIWLCGIAEISGETSPVAATDVQDNDGGGCELDCRMVLLDKNIVFKTSEPSDLKEYTEYYETRKEGTLVGSFINHSDDNRYVLYCFERGTSYVATITLLDGKHVVTIGGFDCSTRERLDETSYVLLKEVPGQTKVLEFGINPYATPNKWCRFEICSDCTYNKVKCIGGYGRSRPIIQDGLFQWSEKGIKLTNELQLGVSDDAFPVDVAYKSNGNLKFEFVYTCYKDRHEVIRSVKGKRIISIKRHLNDLLRCSQGNLIQEFYIFEIKKNPGAFNELVNVYQTSDANQNCDDPSWYYGGKSPDNDRKEWMVYHFDGKIQPKIPFWKQISGKDLNFCPSIYYEKMLEGSLMYLELHKTYTMSPVAYYKNKRETHFLTCFRAEDKLGKNSRLIPNDKYFILVSDDAGGYVVTIEYEEDCSSVGSIDRKLFLKPSGRYGSIKANLVGFRISIDEWCTYIMYRVPQHYTAQMRNVMYVHYDYKPKDDVLQWKKADSPPQCPNLPISGIVFEHIEPPVDTLSGRYLLRTRDTNNYRYFLLYCYTAQDGNVNVFKTLEGKTIMSIIGQDCLYTKTKDKLFYLASDEIKEHNYLAIGTRTSAEDTWCEYLMCIECEERGPRLSFELIPKSSGVEISEAGFEWKGGSFGPGYDTNKAFKHYVLEGESAFGLVCTKVSDKEFKLDLMSAKGIRIGSIELPKIDCSKDVISGFDLNFLVSSDGKTQLYSTGNCRYPGCEVEPGNGLETWVYYILQDNSKYAFKAQKEELCKEHFIARENIQPVKSSDKGWFPTTSWNAANPKIKIICSKTTTVVSIKEKEILTLDKYNCNPEQYQYMKELYIEIVNGDINHIAIGGRYSTTQAWCGYSVFRTGDQIDVQRTYGYKPDGLSMQWYYVNSKSCPGLPKENIIVNAKPSGNSLEKVDIEQSKLNMYVGKYKAIQKYKILYCYERNSKDYTAVIKSVKGDTELTIKGLDCSNKRIRSFSMSYTMNSKKSVLALFVMQERSSEWCGYHICLNCKEPEIQVYVHAKYREYNTISWTKLSRTVEAVDRKAKHSPRYFEPKYHAFVRADLTSFSERSVERNFEFKIDIKKPEGYQLLMKFIDYNSGYHLNCYMPQKDGEQSFAMITDKNENHIVTILKYGCSSQDIAGFTGLKAPNPNADDDIINIRYEFPKNTLYIGICLKCIPTFIATDSPFEEIDMPRPSWIMVAPNDCPLPNHNIIQGEEKQIVQNNEPEISYISTNPHGMGVFTLTCLKPDADFVSLFKNQIDMHLLYFKGGYCPSLKTLTSSPVSLHETRTVELIMMGNPEGDWCQFITKITRKTDKMVIYDINEYEHLE